MRAVFLMALLLLAVLAVAPARAAEAGTHVSVDAGEGEDRRELLEARTLSRAHKFDAANEIFLRWIKAHPKDAEAHFDYGYNLFLQAEAEDRPALAKSLRRRARALLVKAQKLGSTDALIDQVVSSLNADGSLARKTEFSQRKDADDLMHAGETAFAKGDLDAALAAYAKVLEIEPENYPAALFSGDVYFNQRKLDRACTWFEKAIAINPDIETAHRYLGDALARLDRPDDALAQYIEAIVAEPYNRLPRQMLERYAQARRLKWRARPVKLPVVAVEMSDKGPALKLDPDASALELIYGLACVKFRSEDFAAQFPGESVARRSLPEEVAALKILLETAGTMRVEKAADLEPWTGLATLEAASKDGLLEAFVLFERVDRDIAQDYEDYRAANREKLTRYVRRFWCGIE